MTNATEAIITSPQYLYNTIYSKIRDIENALREGNMDDEGLFTGKAGVAVFYANFYELTKDEMHLGMAIELINQAISAMETKEMNYTYCSGFTGICCALQYFVSKGYIRYNLKKTMKEIDIYAYKFTENDLRAGNYDFMHGGLSAGIYFTDREAGRTLDKRLENMLTILAQNATISENGITWEDKLTKYFTQHYQPDYDITNIEYNLGLSHGMPGILVFLQRCLNRKIQVKECRRLLEGGVTWLLNHASSENEICYYGTKVISGKESSKSSRLAWCYGDLGIMTTLWQCAETLNDQKVMQHAINIGLKAAKRSFENEPPVDAGICHGTAGIAQLFNRMYQNCGEPRFKKAAIHWLEATLKLAKHHDGYAGYKKFINEGYVNEEGVLEGVAGIGLVLISALSGKLDWDRLILIS